MKLASLTAIGGILLVGCTTIEPTGGIVPEPGMGVAFDINDVGRVALGGQIGPEIGQIEGMMLQKDSADYLVAVETVHFLRGGDQVWRGEHVHIKPQYISTVYSKQFSKARTAMASAAGGVIVAAIFGRAIAGDGSKDNPAMKQDSAATIRIPRP